MRSPGTFASVTGSAQLFLTPAGSALYSSVVQTNRVALGSLSGLVAATASTSTLTIAANWQVSTDNSTYYDVVPPNNAANVVLITGNGTGATTSKVVPCQELFGWKYARLKAYTGVATADAAVDGVTFTVKYIKA